MVDIRKLIVTLALKLSGIEYIWGGSSPRYGFDCSGFVIWILQVFGLLPAGDWTAGTLSKAFQETSDYQPGNLVFYGKDRDRIYHVMMYVGEMGPMGHSVIGASGGDSTTTTIDENSSSPRIVG